VLDRVLSYVRQHGLMRPGDRVGVAVSGGADSVALLRLLLEARAELGIVLSVVHFNHKIRGADADADEQFVRQLACGFDLEFHSDSDDTPAYAREHKLSLEAAGRALRYAFFDRLTADATVHRVATAHTLDDQAETVLMRFLRGSGTRGLAGIYPGVGGWISMSIGGKKPDIPPTPRIVRPLLAISRKELRAYLQQVGQIWREDASNADVSFTRNRLRHEIMPVLRQLNPNLDQVLGDTADVAREEERWWTEQINNGPQDYWAPRPNLPRGAPGPLKLRVDALLALACAMRRRVIRMVLEQLVAPVEFRHVEAVLALAAAEPSRNEKIFELPDGWEAVRQDRELWFRRRCQSTEGHEYSLALRVPGEVDIAVVQKRIRATLLPGARDSGLGTRDSAVLDPALARRGLYLRNWHAGDRYWPSHTSQPKKVKELLQARHIPRELKPYWPVVVSGDEIVWIPGFDAPERFRIREGDSKGLLLEEVPLGQSGEKEP
jgi:tRNA(Ile)-lysidine synthase